MENRTSLFVLGGLAMLIILIGGWFYLFQKKSSVSSLETLYTKEVFEKDKSKETSRTIIPSRPLECLGLKETDANLPRSCELWFALVAGKRFGIGTGTSEILVTEVLSHYPSVGNKPNGWFKTGQDADILLSGIDFNTSGGALFFNHPGGIASDDVHLLFADSSNNRVLFWSKLPSVNTPPDLVLGQKGFSANNPGRGFDQMNWPADAAIAGKKIVVADTYNNRVLIWNDLPNKSGAPADIVIKDGGDETVKKRILKLPLRIWTNGERLAVVSTQTNTILIWNNFPTRNDQPADLYIKFDSGVQSPHAVTSDGTHLVISGERVSGDVLERGYFFWKEWPKIDNAPYDFFTANSDEYEIEVSGDFAEDGKLFLLGRYLHIWNAFPKDEKEKPTLSLGPFDSGDDADVEVAGRQVYLSLSEGNRIVVFNNIPSATGTEPNFAIGSPDIHINTRETNFVISNPLPVTDGKSLFVSSDTDHKLYVWRNLPDKSGARPDFYYTFAFGAPKDSELFGNTLVLAGGKNVYIWKKLPLKAEMPDVVFNNAIGSVSFKNIQGVAMDNTYFYLADAEANKIYVWEGIPSQNSDPKFSIDALSPGRLSSDGTYLVDASVSQNIIRIFRIADFPAKNKSIAVLGGSGFNAPEHAIVAGGHLFVADGGFNHVLLWKFIEDALAGKHADTILGASDFEDLAPEIGRNKLFMPAGLAFDGSFLWVGESELSSRLLRFSVR